MKVKIKRASMWFQVGETYDIDSDVARQLIALGDAESVEPDEPQKEVKTNKQAEAREKKEKK
jgi:hypothetical protein